MARYFESLPDPRHRRNRRHLLVDIITISVCGVIVGCDGPTAMPAGAKAKKDWLKELLGLPNGVPSRDCIRRVLSALKPEAFQQCFEGWIASLGGESVESRSMIAINGKTWRRSQDHRKGLGPLHLVRAWATGNGLSLGQAARDEKSNEITVIFELIDRIDVKGALITIAAMGCQKDIAKQIVDAQGDYVLAVKDHPPKLHEAIKALFSDERQAELSKMPHRQHQTTDKSHACKEERYYLLAKWPEDFPLQEQWPGIKAVGGEPSPTAESDSEDCRQ